MTTMTTMTRLGLALAICLAAPSARGDTEVGVFVGWHVFSHTNELGAFDNDPTATSPSDGATFGLRLGFGIVPRLTLEGELAITPTDVRGGGADLLIIGWRLNAVFTL